jgi:pimeloyl-ACP methyl ester carboxylesterase
MADFVAVVRKSAAEAPITLLGHSAGGGFALRIASSPIKDQFARTVLLAPYLGYDAPTNRPKSGGWATADMPRFFALAVMRRVGIDCCEPLPTLAFAVPANSASILAPTYSYRLMRNFATRSYRGDLAAVTKPLTLIAGADDELMLSDKYADALHVVVPAADVKLLDGIDHMGIVSTPSAVNAIAEDVATRGMTGS